FHFVCAPIRRCPMISRIWRMIPAISAVALLFLTSRCLATSPQAMEKKHLAQVEAQTYKLSDAAELLQHSVVEELSGVKEKQLYQKIDQLLHDLTKMEKLSRKPAPAREDLYKLFDNIDSEVTLLAKAVPESAPKH